MNSETPYLLAHLAGKEPITGFQFNDGFLLNHAFWEQTSLATFERMKYSRTVNSLPEEDQAQLTKLAGARARESLSQVDFVLTESDCRVDLEEIRNGPEFVLPDNPLYTHGAHYAVHRQERRPSFNIHLRVIERLCREGKLWIAIAPESSACPVWRYGHPKSESDFVAPPELAGRCLGATNINLVLEGLTATIRQNPECTVDLLVFKTIGFEVQNTETALKGRRWTIDPAMPFVATRIDPEDLYSICACATPILVANEAFLQLLQTHPAEAQKLYDAAVLDIHTYSKQSEETAEYTLEQFQEQFAANLALLLDQKAAQREAITRLGNETAKLIRDHIESLSPQLSDMLDGNVRGTEVHLKEFSLRGTELTLRATVEHPLHVVTVLVRGDRIEIVEKPRKRR